jgi:hypothetical protein
MVRAYVDHAIGGVIRQYGGRGMCWGTATPVWPPAASVNRAWSLLIWGGPFNVGSGTAAKTMPKGPILSLVRPALPWPDVPVSATRPVSTPIQASSWLVNRMASVARTASMDGSWSVAGGRSA